MIAKNYPQTKSKKNDTAAMTTITPTILCKDNDYTGRKERGKPVERNKKSKGMASLLHPSTMTSTIWSPQY